MTISKTWFGNESERERKRQRRDKNSPRGNGYERQGALPLCQLRLKVPS